MKTMNKITKAEFVDLLSTLKGSTFVSFMAKTDSRAKKRGNPHGTIWKVYNTTGLVNFHYDSAVLNRLKKEGKDESEFHRGSSWHELVTTDEGFLTPFARHKDTKELYLRVWLMDRSTETVYMKSDNTVLTYDEVKEWLPKPSSYDNQGLDNPVHINVYKLESILEFTVNGKTYSINN